MANSRRYNRLVSRINSLEINLLPAVKVSGNYTKKESDLIRSKLPDLKVSYVDVFGKNMLN